MDHLLYTRQIPNARIIHITLVAEHTDGGPLAAGYRSRRVPQFSNGFYNGFNLLLSSVVVHYNEHEVTPE